MVALNGLASMIMNIARKQLSINHIPWPLSVRGLNSDDRCIKESPSRSLPQALRADSEKTYAWIASEVAGASYAGGGLSGT